MKKVLSTVLLIVSVVMLISSCGESSEKYNQRAFMVADSITKANDLCYGYVSLRTKTWKTIIYDHKYINPITDESEFCFTFNEGLEKFNKDMSPIAEGIIATQHINDSLFITIKECPEKSKEVFENIQNLYLNYQTALELAMEPEGSLQSYTSDFNKAYGEYKELKNIMKVIK